MHPVPDPRCDDVAHGVARRCGVWKGDHRPKCACVPPYASWRLSQAHQPHRSPRLPSHTWQRCLLSSSYLVPIVESWHDSALCRGERGSSLSLVLLLWSAMLPLGIVFLPTTTALSSASTCAAGRCVAAATGCSDGGSCASAATATDASLSVAAAAAACERRRAAQGCDCRSIWPMDLETKYPRNVETARRRRLHLPIRLHEEMAKRRAEVRAVDIGLPRRSWVVDVFAAATENLRRMHAR